VADLERYHGRLEMREAAFSPRVDNLYKFLADLASLLGGVSNRLANAPRDVPIRLTEETASDVVLEREHEIRDRTPWREIDNNFYYARGVLYVVRQLMIAVKDDFLDVITQRNAGDLLTTIIRTLDRTQFEPLIIANGDRDSLWANHSLQLQALLEDARQKPGSLQNVLAVAEAEPSPSIFMVLLSHRPSENSGTIPNAHQHQESRRRSPAAASHERRSLLLHRHEYGQWYL
jgi:hypothetical protein